MKPPFPKDVDVPAILAWCSDMARHVRKVGVPLDARQTPVARTVGVVAPERIRVLVVDTMPYPDELREWADFIFSENGGAPGMSLGDSILLNRKTGMSPRVLGHECVHTMQYHRIGGGMKGYVFRYFEEMALVGYLMSPMEIEARNLACLVPDRYPT